MDLTVGLITWNARDMLRDLLESLKEGMREVDGEIVLVDNRSTDGSVRMVKESYPDVQLIENTETRGVAKARNQVLGPARGRYMAFLDVDALVKPGAMKTLVQTMDAHPEAGIGGPKLVYRDGRLQLSCRPFPSIANIVVEGTYLREFFPNSRLVRDYTMEDWSHDELRPVDWMYGACLIIRRELFAELRGFDEGFFYQYEDVDLCWRAKQLGHEVIYIPDAVVTHFLDREAQTPGDTPRAWTPMTHPLILQHIRSIIRFLWRKHFGLAVRSSI